jgi:hypothetical protein
MEEPMGVKTILECDKCRRTLELRGPYHIAKKDHAAEGWKNKLVNDKWVMLCPNCKGGK